LLFLTGSAAPLLNRFSFIPSSFCSSLLNDPCQQVDPGLEQNKIRLIFPAVLNLFYNIKAIGLILHCSGKGCTGTWVKPWQLRPFRDKALADLHAFTRARKSPGNFPLHAFSLTALTGAEAVLQIEENSALNTGTGAGMEKACWITQFISLTKQICPLPFPVLHLSCVFPCASAILGFFKVE